MKKFFAVAAVAGMAVLASCGNAEDLAAKLQDSIDNADSMMEITMKAKQDSTDNADSIHNLEVQAQHVMDSTAEANHADSVAKKLIK